MQNRELVPFFKLEGGLRSDVMMDFYMKIKKLKADQR
jgi:hypothetical protein